MTTATSSSSSSTQHPSEIQQVLSHVLGLPRNKVVVQRAAHGRRLRRQGDAGQHVGGARRARGMEDAAPGSRAARSRRRHDAHGQAPPVPRRVRRWLRRRGQAPRAPCLARLGRWLGARFSASRSATARCSTSTTLLHPERRRHRPRRQDAPRVAHGLPRVRRAAGNGGHRGRHRPRRAHARPRARDRARARTSTATGTRRTTASASSTDRIGRIWSALEEQLRASRRAAREIARVQRRATRTRSAASR